VNHCLVRGLDYYTRTVFEIQPQVDGAQSTIGGGGRYDNLIEELGGKPTPALGFASGIERIILNLKKQSVGIPPIPQPQVFIAHTSDRVKNEVTKLASSLRRASVGAFQASSSKSLKAQLRQANNIGVRYVIIIGDEEIKIGAAILRNMTTGEQDRITIAELPDKLLCQLQ
jgi:histidyl-tRNA synthetase